MRCNTPVHTSLVAVVLGLLDPQVTVMQMFTERYY